tara:strand:+ start:62 stop:1078 length:1017 start_codon:yes stop_codon:yes gene_type:complete
MFSFINTIKKFFKQIWSFVKKIIFEYFIGSLYKKYEAYYFPLMSKAPEFLNYAYPDFSVQYFISTFSKKETLFINGLIPLDKVNFFCITLYNKDGLPYFSKNDYQIVNFNIIDTDLDCIEYSETIDILESSSLIIRFYTKNKFKNHDFYEYLPSLSTSKIFDVKNIKKNSIKLGTLLQDRISRQNNFIDSEVLQNNYFYKPNKSKLKNLFPNKDAEYLIAFPKTKIVLIKIKTEFFCQEDFRFIGFMASNYQTTATDSSISLEESNHEYRIWICYSNDVCKLNIKQNDIILNWNNNNQYPILVYREVRIKDEGLKKLVNQVEPKYLRTIMNYPEIEYY